MRKLIGQKWFRQLFHRRVLIILMLLIQIWFVISLISSGSKFSWHINRLLTLISLFVALYIVSKKDKGAYKLTWIFLILLFPLFGGLMYLLFNFQTSIKRFSQRILLIHERTNKYFFLPETGYETAKSDIPNHLPQIRYLQEFAKFPVYTHSTTHYLSPGEKMFEVLKEELEKAEKYIFL